eukprot:gene5909-6355_t
MESWLIATSILAVIVFFFISSVSSSKKGEKRQERTKIEKPQEISSHTEAEVAKHNRREDCWIIVDGKVYDVTGYVDDHPGGDAILNNAGKDSTVGFKGPQHPPSVIDVLKLYYIGDLKR